MYIYALLWKVSLFLKRIRYESKTFFYYRKDYGRKIRLEIIKIFYNIPIYAELQIYKNNLLPKSYFTSVSYDGSFYEWPGDYNIQK